MMDVDLKKAFSTRVDDERHRSVGRERMQRDFLPLTPARGRRVVRGIETGAHHGEDRPDEALGLAQWQEEDQAGA